MIARYWRGWTTPENADIYEKLLHEKILPKIQAIEGYKGAMVMNRELDSGGGAPSEIEFATMTYWSSLDVIQNFVGEDIGRANIPDEAAKLMKRWDERVVHYEMLSNHKD